MTFARHCGLSYDVLPQECVRGDEIHGNLQAHFVFCASTDANRGAGPNKKKREL